MRRRLAVLGVLALVVCGACIAASAVEDHSDAASAATANRISILTSTVLLIVADQNHLKPTDLVVVGWEADIVPSTRVPVYRFHVAQLVQLNGAIYTVAVTGDGRPVDLQAIERSEGVRLFQPFPGPETLALNPRPTAEISSRTSITPSSNAWILQGGESVSETINVSIPGGSTNVDVYFLADTTGSMDCILAQVRSEAQDIMNQLASRCPNVDFAFGVGAYRDFQSTPADLYQFEPQLALVTGAGAIAAASTVIGTQWIAAGGDDWPECQLFALHQVATDPIIGWRSGALHLIVWIGDAQGHDPICNGYLSVPPGGINEAHAIADLAASTQQIRVLAIDVYSLNGIPDKGSYTCPNTGTAGQAVRIAAQTDGDYWAGVNATTVANAIVSSVLVATNSFDSVHLHATGGTAPFTTSITPSAGYSLGDCGVGGDFAFAVTFTAPPCSGVDQIYTGAIDVIGVLNGQEFVIASKPVTMTVPRCTQWSYAIKLVCGVAREGEPEGTPVRPGTYTTEVNILNYHDMAVTVRKCVYPLIYEGEVRGREPRAVECIAEDAITLKPHTATMDDCWRMCQLTGSWGSCTGGPLSVYYLELVSDAKLAVTAVYTVTGEDGRCISLEVKEIDGQPINP